MDTADRQEGRKIACPLLVLWGKQSHTGTVWGDVLAIWRDYARIVSGAAFDCGHHLPVEASEETLQAFLRHFKA
jgi:haloacetate dehalogenase